MALVLTESRARAVAVLERAQMVPARMRRRSVRPARPAQAALLQRAASRAVGGLVATAVEVESAGAAVLA
jgi:hypothetical protein